VFLQSPVSDRIHSSRAVILLSYMYKLTEAKGVVLYSIYHQAASASLQTMRITTLQAKSPRSPLSTFQRKRPGFGPDLSRRLLFLATGWSLKCLNRANGRLTLCQQSTFQDSNELHGDVEVSCHFKVNRLYMYHSERFGSHHHAALALLGNRFESTSSCTS
jgi:hypothetical protein